MSGGGSKISEKYFDSIKKKYVYIYIYICPLMSAQCCGVTYVYLALLIEIPVKKTFLFGKY